jgi:hypothetical protein
LEAYVYELCNKDAFIILQDPDTSDGPHALLGGLKEGQVHCDNLAALMKSLVIYLDTNTGATFYDLSHSFDTLRAFDNDDVMNHLKGMNSWLKSNRQYRTGWHVLREYVEKAAHALLDKWNIARQHPRPTTVGPGDIVTFDTTDFHCRPAGCEERRIAIFATFRLRGDETDGEWAELKTTVRNAHLQANKSWTTETPLTSRSRKTRRTTWLPTLCADSSSTTTAAICHV